MTICVYCSASNNIAQHYKDMARKLGEWIAQNGHTLLFGGATGGLMTEVSKGAASKGGNIIGVVPQRIVGAGRESHLVTTRYLVQTMNERKDKLKDLADVFIALPGSYGTMDELFDVVASGTVGEHRKPIIVLNYEGFYDFLFAQINKMKAEHFIPLEEHYKPLISKNLSETITLLQQLSDNKKQTN